MVGWGLVRLDWQCSVRRGTVCHGLAGLLGYGMVGSCTACLGLAGEVRQCALGIGWVMQVKVRFSVAGMVRLVVLCSGTVWFGWRVMVRLGAVLCGTVMYGLVRLARLGVVV